VCDKADEGIGFMEGCKGYFHFFSTYIGTPFFLFFQRFEQGEEP
jgi:hypothetical protein